MLLFCFDVDGTLDCSAGPVPVGLLTKLMANDVYADLLVVIVSPSGAYQGDLPRTSDRPSRRECLLAARELFMRTSSGVAPLVQLYVSDNKDFAEAQAAGFCYIEAAEFAKGIT